MQYYIAKFKKIQPRKILTILISFTLLFSLIVQPFLVSPTRVEAAVAPTEAQEPFQFPQMGVDDLQNPEYYEEFEAPVAIQAPISLDSQIEAAPIEREPARIETLDKNYYGFSITVDQSSDFSEISFQVKHKSGELSKEFIIEPVDTFFGDIEPQEIATINSELYTFAEGITEIHFFYEGEKEFDIQTFEFTNFDARPDGLIGVKPNDFASPSAEQLYKETLFNKLGFDLITREEWGGPTGSTWAPTVADVTKFVVHHTATGVDMNNPKNTVRAIYNSHYYRCANNIGSYDPDDPNCDEISELWQDIGYNYLIDPYGNIYEGRAGGIGAIGAHSPPNTGTIGISILGNYVSQEPTQASLVSLSKLISSLAQLNNLTPAQGATVFGHRDRNATACPGALLYNKLSHVTSTANSYTGQNSLLLFADQERDRLITAREYHEINGEVEVILDVSGMNATLKEKILTESRGVTSVRQVGDTVFYTVPQAKTDQIIAETLVVAESTRIQPNYVYRISAWDNSSPTRSIPSDYNTSTHWTHEKTKTPEAWKDMGGCTVDNTCGGENTVVVAVIDTGVAYENYDYDAGTTFTTTNFSGFYIEDAVGAADGQYNEGYDREYTQSAELTGVNFVNPKDTAQQYLCALRALSPDPGAHCNATETAKINHANDDHGHGTFVSTIIAGRTSDAAPNKIVGIAHNVSIMPIKAMLPNDTTMCQTSGGALDLTCSNPYYDYRSVGTSYTISQGIDHARANGAEVINMSLGGEGSDPTIANAVTNAYNAGITVVVSAGNENDNIANYYPASYNNVIAVGSTNSDNSRSNYSNYGSQLDIVAPVGQSGQSRIASQTYSCFGDPCSDETNPNLFKIFTSNTTPSVGTGTSYAAPQAAAAVALAKSAKGTLTPANMYNLLAGTATPLGGGFNSYTGYGLLNIEEVVNNVDSIPDLPTRTTTFSANADNLADIIAYNPSTKYIDVTPSTGGNFGGGWRGYQVWNTNSGYDAANWQLLKPADVNGDGMVDIIAFNKYTTQVDVTLSTGGNFGGGWRGFQVWNYKTGYSTSDWNLLDPADVNGDGMADLIAFNPRTKVIDVTPSTGTTFGGGYKGYEVWNSNSGYGSDWVLLPPADVNGDNMADIIAVNRFNRYIDVTLSWGTTFGGGWRGYQVWNTNSGYSPSDWALLAPADVNGDGLADIIAYNPYNKYIDVTLSWGNSFGGGWRGYQVWNTNSGYSLNDWWLLDPADVNGDGLADIIAYNPYNKYLDVTLSWGTTFGGGWRGYQVWNTNSGYGSDWDILN